MLEFFILYGITSILAFNLGVTLVHYLNNLYVLRKIRENIGDAKFLKLMSEYSFLHDSEQYRVIIPCVMRKKDTLYLTLELNENGKITNEHLYFKIHDMIVTDNTTNAWINEDTRYWLDLVQVRSMFPLSSLFGSMLLSKKTMRKIENLINEQFVIFKLSV